MADPISLIAGIGMAASGVGSLISAAGAEQQGRASSESYAYQANIAQLNANLAKQNQQMAFQTGDQQALNTGLQLGQQMGQITAAQSSSGFDIRSGSAQRVRASQREIGNIDLATIRSNAARTAYNYQVQAQADTEQGQLYTSASQNALTAGNIGATSSFLGGVSSVSNEWLNAGRLGMFGINGGMSTGDDYL